MACLVNAFEALSKLLAELNVHVEEFILPDESKMCSFSFAGNMHGVEDEQYTAGFV